MPGVDRQIDVDHCGDVAIVELDREPVDIRPFVQHHVRDTAIERGRTCARVALACVLVQVRELDRAPKFRARGRELAGALVAVGEVEQRADLWIFVVADLELRARLGELAGRGQSFRFGERRVGGGLVGARGSGEQDDRDRGDDANHQGPFTVTGSQLQSPTHPVTW